MIFPLTRSSRWAITAALAALLALPLLFFWPLVFTDAVLVDYDLFAYFYPYREAVREALAAGRFPLWNPDIFMGAPLFANVQTAILYPFNALTWWIEPPYQVNLSIVSHVMLAGLLSFALGRWGLRLGTPAAFAMGAAWAFSGFLAQQTGHINQLNASVWLPGLALALLYAIERRSLLALALGTAGVTLQFLAGHTQEFYLSLIALGLTTLALLLRRLATAGPVRRRGPRGVVPALRGDPWLVLWPLLVLAVMTGLGMAIAAVQLLPTLELSSFSARGGGLPFDEGRSFSLPPWQLLWGILPGYTENPFTEFIGYIGLLGVGLALVGLITSPRRWARDWALLLVLVALFMALGGFNPLYQYLYDRIPGLNLFRVPARWLFLYTLGASILVGLGVEGLVARRPLLRPRGWPRWISARPRPVGAVLLTVAAVALLVAARFSRLPGPVSLAIWGVAGVAIVAGLVVGRRWLPATAFGVALGALLVVDLFAASRALPYNNPVPADAWFAVRPTTSELQSDGGLFRVLSIADTRYLPSDEVRSLEWFTRQWPRQAVIDMLSSLKLQEVVSANVNMSNGIASIDGYDGGVLPLRRYILFKQRLLETGGLNRDTAASVDPGQPDGILRFQLEGVPDARLLRSINVGYVVADRLFDVWKDGVYYDLSLRNRVAPGETKRLGQLPVQPASRLGLVTYLEGAAAVERGMPAAVVGVTLADGRQVERTLLTGVDTAEGQPRAGQRHERPASIGRWRGSPESGQFLTSIELGPAEQVRAIDVRNLLPSGTVVVSGAALSDPALDRSQPLIVDNDFSLASSGDVKLYRLENTTPRAYLVPNWAVVPTMNRANELRGDPDVFVALEGREPAEVVTATLDPAARVDIVSYAPERIVMRVSTPQPVALVVTEAFYPGWVATVDGRPAEILPADVLFRGLLLEAGDHKVVMTYEPASLARGLSVTWLALTVWLVLLAAGAAQWLGRLARRRPAAQPRGSVPPAA